MVCIFAVEIRATSHITINHHRKSGLEVRFPGIREDIILSLTSPECFLIASINNLLPQLFCVNQELDAVVALIFFL